jgi:hypothetical protein
MTENQEAWKTWQIKIAKSSQYTNPNISQIGSGDPNLRATIVTIPDDSSLIQTESRQAIGSASQPSYDTTIKTNEREITAIDIKLNNVITKKDELKLQTLQNLGSKGNDVQIKTTQNSAYQNLVSTESELINRKSQLQEQISVARDKLQLGGLDSQAGQQFSAGISLDPVMDHDIIIQEVPTAPAMNPSERARFFGKEDTLLNPKYSMEDVAQGLTEQGASYLGGDNTILDKAIASPILDIKHGLSNPSEFQLAQDYGYTNMDASAKEISNNPARFTGNVITSTAMALAPFGAVIKVGGKVGGNIVKLTAKEINNVERLTMKAEMGKLIQDPKVANIVRLDIKSNYLLTSTAPIKKVTSDIASLYTKTDLNPSGTVNSVDLGKLNQQKRIITNENLKTVENNLGTFFEVTGYSKKNINKYTGVGLGLGGASSFTGASFFGDNKKKTKKQSSTFNFKY